MPRGLTPGRVRLTVPGFRTYASVVTALGLTATVLALTRVPAGSLPAAGAGFWTLAALLLLAELRPLVTAGTAEASGVTLSTAFVFAVLLHWGLPVAVAVQTVATLLADLARRRTAWRTAFNVAQYTFAWSAAALALHLSGRLPGLTDPARYSGADLPATLLAAAVYFVVNDTLVTAAVSLYEKPTVHEFRARYRRGLASRAFTESALLALAPIIVVVMERGAVLLPLLLLPIAAVYAAASVSAQRDHQAHHDALTRLPNRKLLLRRAAEALSAARRSRGQAALILVDLDRFKEVNDTLGHATGDALLRLVGRRLSGAVRPGDTVARLGGDEFAVLLPKVRGADAAQEVATRMHRALAAPFRHDGATFEVDGSFGIAVAPDHGRDVTALLQRADVAMYLAKETGTGVEVYAPDRDRHSATRLGLFGELRRALAAGDLEVHYQPEVVLGTGSVHGVEALLRWAHPERGVLSPDEFLRLAETSGLMREITRYVLDVALGQVAVWRAAGLPTPVSVNVSARDLHDPGFLQEVASALRGHGLGRGCLTLEVTESVLLADPERVADTLGGLSALGVGVALDDFGTGYSSLAHLRRLPVTEMKIDRSFVSRVDASPADAAIVSSIVQLGAALGLHVVAEGVESRRVRSALERLGCPVGQGHYLARPLPAHAITPRLRRRSAGVALLELPPSAPAARSMSRG